MVYYKVMKNPDVLKGGLRRPHLEVVPEVASISFFEDTPLFGGTSKFGGNLSNEHVHPKAVP